MKIPIIKGIIRRRVLLNYRVDSKVVQEILPSCFRPKLHEGYSIVGICLIRLEKMRPKGTPEIVGFASENSAHRIAVEWDDSNCGVRCGVFVPRRDTNSYLNALAGGRIFPGVQSLSRFSVNDKGDSISLRVDRNDSTEPFVDFLGSESDEFPPTSIFRTLKESSEFFESGSVGYSPRVDSCTLDGMSLRVANWKVSPLKVEYVRSSYFDNEGIFPAENIEFDHALLMRKIDHEWHSEPAITSSHH